MKMVLWDLGAGEQTQILFEKVMLLLVANVQLIISLLHQAHNLHELSPSVFTWLLTTAYFYLFLFKHLKRK